MCNNLRFCTNRDQNTLNAFCPSYFLCLENHKYCYLQEELNCVF